MTGRRQLRARAAATFAALALCLLGLPAALAETPHTGGPDPMPPKACWSRGEPGGSGESTESSSGTDDGGTEDGSVDTTDTTIADDDNGTDPTETTIDGGITDDTVVDPVVDPLPIDWCWFGPVDPGVCFGWPRLIIDPPIIDPPATEVPPTDGPDITIEPNEPPFTDGPDITIEPDEPPFRGDPDTVDPTVTTILPPVDRPEVHCVYRPLPDPGTPLGVSADGRRTIIGLSPSVLPADDSFEGGRITIYGSGFEPGSTVMIGDLECTSVEVIDDTTITCDPPVGAVGTADLIVIGPDGESVTAPEALEFLDPAGFWTRPVYVYSSNPLVRSLVGASGGAPGGAADELGSQGTDQVIPTFTG